MTEQQHESKVTVMVLPYGSSSPSFERASVLLDPLRHTGSTIKEKLCVRSGLIVHGAAIVDDTATVRSWYSPSFPVLLVECAKDFTETEEWAANQNSMARLLNAQVHLNCALVLLSRAFWHDGYTQFLSAATFLKSLVESANTYDFQRRMEVVTLSYPRGELQPIAPFLPTNGTLLLPPSLRGDPTGGPIVGEWCDVPRGNLSSDERDLARAQAAVIKEASPYLQRAAKAVVRIFGYHSLDHDSMSSRSRAIPFTGFFVSPIHILTVRSNVFCAETNTYAHRFAFTTSVRAQHGMLTEDVDLFPCHEVPDQIPFLADTIRDIGVLVEDSKMPHGLQSAPWCDLMLLVVDYPSRHSRSDTEYLLPEILSNGCGSNGDDGGNGTTAAASSSGGAASSAVEGKRFEKGDSLYALYYGSKPTGKDMEFMFGPRGHSKETINEEILRTQFWSYDGKVCAVGQALDGLDHRSILRVDTSLLVGSRGAPLIRRTHVEFDNEAAKRKRIGEESHGLEYAATYCAISIGRSTEQWEADRDNIISMSTSDIGRVDSLRSSMYNDATPVTHTCLTLLYLKHIAPAIQFDDHRHHVAKFLAPFTVLMSKPLLSQCHRKMIKDADDFNEYGMDFYEHHDVCSALACFREGAKMFTTASIPNLSQYEIDLRTALQTNVSAVVVAIRKQGGSA